MFGIDAMAPAPGLPAPPGLPTPPGLAPPPGLRAPPPPEVSEDFLAPPVLPPLPWQLRRLPAKRHAVSFDLDSVVCYEVPAYSEVYGAHPRLFVFDKHGGMIPAGPGGFNTLEASNELEEGVSIQDEAECQDTREDQEADEQASLTNLTTADYYSTEFVDGQAAPGCKVEADDECSTSTTGDDDASESCSIDDEDWDSFGLADFMSFATRSCYA